MQDPKLSSHEEAFIVCTWDEVKSAIDTLNKHGFYSIDIERESDTEWSVVGYKFEASKVEDDEP